MPRPSFRLKLDRAGVQIAPVSAKKNGDYEYGTERLVHLVHETHLIFISAGNYRDYREDQFGPDPD